MNITSYQSSGADQYKVIGSSSGSAAAGCGATVGVPSTAPTSWDCYDTGGGAVTIIGINSQGGQAFQESVGVGYGGPVTVAGLAAELAAGINQMSTPSYTLAATVAQVSASDAQLTVSATQLASAPPIVQFVITSGSGLSCSGNNGNFSPCSFALTAPGGGPPSVVQIPAVTDTGTISVVIDGGQTASYTWKPTDTWSAVQSGLIAAINLQYGGSLTASASSYGVQLTSKQPGYGTNWPVAVSYTSSNPLGTSPAESSYSPTATNMAGGVTAGPGASAGSSYTTVVYTPGGSKLATYTNGVAASTLQAAEIPLPGGGTAMYNSSGLNYLRHSDWLGSSRLATTWGHTVYAKTAYAPFGETYNTYGTDASFTGEDVDPNSGYFNFLYRKFDPVAGRWTSPDPSGLAYADITNPQSLNLYAYVLNNPLSSIDLTGLYCAWDDGTSDDDPSDGGADENACNAQGGHWTDASNPCQGAAGCVATFDWTPPGLLSAWLDSVVTGDYSDGTFNATSISPAGLQFTAGCESFRGKAYNDSNGNCTVGYGHLMHMGACSASELAQGAISPQTALDMLNQDMSSAVAAVNNQVNVDLTQNQFDAMADFTFNVGAKGLQKSAALQDVNSGNMDQVGGDFGHFHRGGAGIIARRANEAAMFNGQGYAPACYKK